MLTIGDIRIHLINDGTIKVDPGGAYGLIPRVLWSRYHQPDENHLIPMVLVCLLVEAGGRKIIVDTGHGSKLDPKAISIMQLQRPQGGLVEGLARLGIMPDEIDLVINTHLHGDHCGGNTRFDDAYNIVPVFPNAEYVVQRREYEDAMRPNERTAATYLPFNYEPLLESGQLRLLEQTTVELAPGVYGEVTRGHTPAHMSVRFESGGEHGLFVCDLASYAVHFERLGWMTGYDVEPLETLESKRRWQAWALETDALLIFPHDHQRTVGRLRRDDAGKPALAVIDEPFV